MGKTVNDNVVSFDSEQLILVDDKDRQIGHKRKAECHDGDGILHRAFSLFIFNDNNELLLQQRGTDKRLWPGYWANSCCSHPRHGETMAQATQRRLQQELGFKCPLEYVYKFQYHARYGDLGSEREFCWVYIGKVYENAVRPNPSEIEATRFVTPEDLDHEIESHSDQFTPWLKLEWTRLREEFRDRLPG